MNGQQPVELINPVQRYQMNNNMKNIREAMGCESHGSNFDSVIFLSSFSRCYYPLFERRAVTWNDSGGFGYGSDWNLVVSHARESVGSEIGSDAMVGGPPHSEVPHLLAKTWSI